VTESRAVALPLASWASIMAGRLPVLNVSKSAQNSAAWCNERAAADLAAAAASDNENIRRRYERSAESWKARAELYPHHT
jgi:hypothetical protein